MSRRHFLKLLLSVLTLAAASFIGLWKWLGREVEAGQSPDTPVPSASPGKTSEPAAKPELAKDPLVSFMILSDTHVNNYFPEPSQKLRKAFDDIVDFETKIETVLITGDITDSGIDSDYREFNRILKDYKKLPPLHANMGNHDYYTIWIDNEGQWKQDAMPNGKSDSLSRKAFMNQFALDKVYHDFKVNGIHIIMLSQETYVQERPEVGEGAWHSDEQMAWFKKTMEQHKDGSPAFVMIHQPLPPAGQDGGSHLLIRNKEFRSILEPYPNVFVFSGHRHENLRGSGRYTKEPFHWIRNASVGRTRGNNPQQNGGLTAQGLFLQVYADRVVIRGREFMDRTWIDEANWTIPLKV